MSLERLIDKTPMGSRAPTEKETTEEVTGAWEGVSIPCMELDPHVTGSTEREKAQLQSPSPLQWAPGVGYTLCDVWLLPRCFSSGLRIFITCLH